MSRSPPACVLVPGFSPFDITGDGVPGLANFGPVVEAFAARGVECRVAEGIPPAAGVEERALALRAALDRLGGRDCILIGHSMGGLDARALSAFLDPARQVKAVVTLGTPHRGSPVANWALSSRRPLPWLVRAFGREGLAELTPEACARRNAVLAGRAAPPILSVAAARPLAQLPPLMRALVPSLFARDEANDGLVSTASARWGEFLGTVPADHFELIGLDLEAAGVPFIRRILSNRAPFRHVPLYLEGYMRALRASGLG